MLLTLAVAVPALFDPHAADVFDLPKLTVLAVGAAALLALGGAGAVFGFRRENRGSRARSTRRPGPPSALTAAIAAVVLWEVISAAGSLEPRVSVIGHDGTYSDTVALVVAGSVIALVARAVLRRTEHVRSILAALYLGGGGLSILYGAVQLHDRLLPHARWDPVHWGHMLFPNVFSTFGNPDHFGGFLAILLPIGIGLLRTSTSRHERAAIAAIGAAALVELLETAARGAWLAAILAVLLVGGDALVRRADRARRRLLGPGVAAAGLLGALATSIAFDGTRLLGPKFHHLVASGPATSIAIREDIWGAALQIGLHHPLRGTGPGTFQDILPTYEPARLAAAVGPRALVNGAHDLLLNRFAEQGAIGAALFLALLAAAFFTLWRIARSHEPGGADTHGARPTRQVLAVSVGGALAAYVVQASFDVEQVGLVFCFWLLLGLAGAMVRGTPKVPSPGLCAAHARRARAPRVARTAVMLTAAAIATGAFAWRATLPLRADHQLWAALSASASTTQHRLALLSSAVALDPWEPLSRTSRGALELRAGLTPGIARLAAANLLRDGASDYEAAAAVAPHDPHVLDGYARALLDAAVHGALPRGRAIRDAIALLRRAADIDPRDPRIAADLSQALSTPTVDPRPPRAARERSVSPPVAEARRSERDALEG